MLFCTFLRKKKTQKHKYDDSTHSKLKKIVH